MSNESCRSAVNVFDWEFVSSNYGSSFSIRRETGLLGVLFSLPILSSCSVVFVSVGQWTLERTLRWLFSIELEFSEHLINLICNRVFFGFRVVGSWCFLCLFLLLVFVSVGQRFSENSSWSLFFSIESWWARIFGRMFLTWRGAGFLGSGWRGWCFLCLLLFLAFVWVMVLGKHPVMDVFWLKVRELDFGEPFLSDVKQDCWVMGGEGGVFSACCFFCYLCLWVDSFEYPLPCGHGGGMCSCGSQISLTYSLESLNSQHESNFAAGK